MKDELVMYECKICNCTFGIDEEDVAKAKVKRRYIACPIDGRHRKQDIVKMVDYRRLMQERNAVNI